MLVFLVPLKSQEKSASWEKVCLLFERTARSICNQTCSDFQVIVVCNQRPTINFSHPKIKYLEVDFPYPSNQPNYLAQARTDKGRKILAGLIAAKEFSPSHIMSVDADDCVSKNLAQFVKNNFSANGWYINQGYKYLNNDSVIYLKPWNFHRISGSCNLLRYDLMDVPENPEYNRGYGSYKFYIDHQKVKDVMAQRNHPIKPLPFPGAVYIIGTNENQSRNENNLKFNFLTRRKLTPEICEEFGLARLEN
ncbi:glycosyltransferase family A protein [Laspinema olomoucense]|uniref:Glycosyltransferase family 2 protein n=1 Tax=Laspinema olomoucense D3b TaxID=2953688 RepID=A0ABT2NG14_9CYAN|nr:glycosyltransferase family A protein [Laspinema sp. D3b]MCT7980655.1 glycosyltransferase family 2 protein [Laspinema sp. D3b]